MAAPRIPSLNTGDPLAATPYRIVRKLGSGGMGDVFEVEHEVIGKLMVAKVLRAVFAQDAGIVDRMRIEAQALAALSHPNIVCVTDFSRAADGRPFYVMERLNGCTVGEEFRRRGALPIDEAVEITRQILRALEVAHQIGLVHRDIKPDNVFLHCLPNGERVVKVLDFGVAKVLSGRSPHGPAPAMVPTAEGAVVGTPRYVSPEQVRGKQIDHRADIYAVGLLLYALVCGRGPFDDRRRPDDLFIAHLSEEPPPPSRFAPRAVSNELDAVILRALRKSPDERFQTAEAFEATLGQIAARWKAPIGWLKTELSPPPLPTGENPIEVARKTLRLPNAGTFDTAREGIGYLEQSADGTPTTESTSLPGPNSQGPTPTELIGFSPASNAAIPTRTAAPPNAASAAEAQPLIATNDATAIETAAPPTVYVAATIAALVTSGIGLWVTQARSFTALAVVLVISVAVSAGTAFIALRFAR